MGQHDVAQVCPNGHVANDSSQRHPEFNKEYCDRCGEKTITTCPECNSPIQGDYHAEGVISIGGEFDPPAFCQHCGHAFPWTERKQQAAIELFIEDNQSEEDQQQFRESVDQITKDTPQAQVASKRIVRLLGTIGKQSASAIRDILVDIASEAAKKMIFPSGP